MAAMKEVGEEAIKVIEALDLDDEAKGYLYDEVMPLVKHFVLKRIECIEPLADDYNGMWVFLFEQRQDVPLQPNDMSKMTKHMEHDDDSQPSGIYRIYFGTLWYMRPYST